MSVPPLASGSSETRWCSPAVIACAKPAPEPMTMTSFFVEGMPPNICTMAGSWGWWRPERRASRSWRARIVVARIGEQAQSLDDARDNLAACARLAEPERKPLLVDIRAARPLVPEVRHYYTGERLDASFSAFGLLVRGSALGHMMGNIYLRIARPGIPTQLFSEEHKALKWLRARK